MCLGKLQRVFVSVMHLAFKVKDETLHHVRSDDMRTSTAYQCERSSIAYECTCRTQCSDAIVIF